MAKSKKKKKSKKGKSKKKGKKKIRVSFDIPTYVDLTRNDIIVMLFLFMALSFTIPPFYPLLGFWGTYFVLLVYMFHSVVLVLIGKYLWENFLNEFFKVRQLHLDHKQKKLK